MSMKWHERWIGLARFIAQWSEDQSTKVGCVIVDDRQDVLSLGWNGLPRGVTNTPERNVRPEKYRWFSHAERNAIDGAAANGKRLRGSALYCTHIPCEGCAGSIIQAGIARVIVPAAEWAGESMTCDHAAHDRTRTVLQEGGVEIDILSETSPPSEA